MSEPDGLSIPYRAWVLGVQGQHRVRVPLEITDVVPWLRAARGASIRCYAVPKRVGMQLISAAAYESERHTLDAAISANMGDSVSASDSWLDAARLLASAWEVSVSVERTRISFPIPLEFRRSGRLPSSGEPVVVFGCGELLEVYAAADWFGHIGALAERRAQVIGDTIERLESE